MEIKDYYGKILFSDKTETIKDTIVAAIKARADLSGANLYEANLSRADLSGVNISWANLSGANLYGANLSGANLYGANISWANLSRADLSGANLSRANLYEADLSRANLSRANLSGANLYGANLYEADLSGADLSRADLYEADLSRANLYEANLSGANISWANLSRADLSGAKNLKIPISCPEFGSFTAFKKCMDNRIVELLIPSEARRSSATTRKCRTNKAIVVGIKTIKNIPCKQANSSHDPSFIYKVGETVEVKDFCEDRFQECAAGIHFFITRQEAIDY